MNLKGWKIFALIGAVVIFSAALFFILERPPKAAELEPEEMLRQGAKAFREMSVAGRQRVEVYRDGKRVKSEEFPSPIEPLLRGKALEGNKLAAGRWLVHEFLAGATSRTDLGEEFLTAHELEILGPEKIAGRWAWEMEIRPKHPGSGTLRVSFDDKTGYPLKRVKYDWQGQKENSIEFTRVDGFEKRRRPPLMPGQMAPGQNVPHMGDGPPPPFQPSGGPNAPRPLPGVKPPGLIPPKEFKKYLSEGKILFPTYIPEGYQFKAARRFPGRPFKMLERVQLAFADGVNVFSIFIIQLPERAPSGEDVANYLHSKLRELHNSFPEGFAMRRIEEGLIIAVGDIAPDVLNEVLLSMTTFQGDEPVWDAKAEGSPDEPL